MARTVVDGIKTNIKLKTRYPILKFDMLQMYCGRPYVIDLPSADGKVVVYVPTMGRLIDIGEGRFYATLNLFTTNTTQYRLALSKANPPIDWNEISDFELFMSLYKQADPEVVKMLFGDLEITKFEPFIKNQTEKILYHEQAKVEINEEVYQHIAQYLRCVFHVHVEEKITKDPILKQMYLQKDAVALERANLKKEKGSEEQSSIQPLLSFCVNHPGFKHSLKDIDEMSVCEFYDSVTRLQAYENTRALIQGSYSGMVDTSKIDKESFNFTRKL